MQDFLESSKGLLVELKASTIGDAVVSYIHGIEALSELFEYKVTFSSANRALDPESILGTIATLHFTSEKNSRFINGVITQFSQGTTALKDDIYITEYSITIRPKLWLLTLDKNCKIFQNKSAMDIIKSVLSDSGVRDISDKTSSCGKGQREYCVQYNESSFNFISRLMEDEGIFYYFTHESNKHTLVLVDSSMKYEKISEKAQFIKAYNKALPLGKVFNTSLDSTMHSGGYALADYNYEISQTRLFSTLDSKWKGSKVYEYPGGFEKTGEGENLSKMRIQEIECVHLMLRGDSTIPSFTPGYSFSLTEHHADNFNKTYVLCRVEHTFQSAENGPFVYRNHFSAFPDGTEFRAPRKTPKPKVFGNQTAVVVCPSGKEIYRNEYCAVKVHFHWDQDGKTKDTDDSSCWIRVAQLMSGSGWGGIFVPRVGQEVVVSFLEGNPDRPLIVGCVYNDQYQPTYSDTDDKKTTFFSASYEDPSRFNEIRFDDTKDKEEIYVHAQKDINVDVDDSSVTTILHAKKGGPGNHSLTLKKGNMTTMLNKGNKTITLEKGNMTIKVNGNYTLDVSGNITIKAGKNIKIEAGQTIVTNSTMDTTINAGMNLKALAMMNFMAQANVSLTAVGMASAILGSPSAATVMSPGAATLMGGGAALLAGVAGPPPIVPPMMPPIPSVHVPSVGGDSGSGGATKAGVVGAGSGIEGSFDIGGAGGEGSGSSGADGEGSGRGSGSTGSGGHNPGGNTLAVDRNVPGGPTNEESTSTANNSSASTNNNSSENEDYFDDDIYYRIEKHSIHSFYGDIYYRKSNPNNNDFDGDIYHRIERHSIHNFDDDVIYYRRINYDVRFDDDVDSSRTSRSNSNSGGGDIYYRKIDHSENTLDGDSYYTRSDDHDGGSNGHVYYRIVSQNGDVYYTRSHKGINRVRNSVKGFCFDGEVYYKKDSHNKNSFKGGVFYQESEHRDVTFNGDTYRKLNSRDEDDFDDHTYYRVINHSDGNTQLNSDNSRYELIRHSHDRFRCDIYRKTNGCNDDKYSYYKVVDYKGDVYYRIFKHIGINDVSYDDRGDLRGISGLKKEHDRNIIDDLKEPFEGDIYYRMDDQGGDTPDEDIYYRKIKDNRDNKDKFDGDTYYKRDEHSEDIKNEDICYKRVSQGVEKFDNDTYYKRISRSYDQFDGGIYYKKCRRSDGGSDDGNIYHKVITHDGDIYYKKVNLNGAGGEANKKKDSKAKTGGGDFFDGDIYLRVRGKNKIIGDIFYRRVNQNDTNFDGDVYHKSGSQGGGYEDIRYRRISYIGDKSDDNVYYKRITNSDDDFDGGIYYKKCRHGTHFDDGNVYHKVITQNGDIYYERDAVKSRGPKSSGSSNSSGIVGSGFEGSSSDSQNDNSSSSEDGDTSDNSSNNDSQNDNSSSNSDGKNSSSNSSLDSDNNSGSAGSTGGNGSGSSASGSSGESGSSEKNKSEDSRKRNENYADDKEEDEKEEEEKEEEEEDEEKEEERSLDIRIKSRGGNIIIIADKNKMIPHSTTTRSGRTRITYSSQEMPDKGDIIVKADKAMSVEIQKEITTKSEDSITVNAKSDMALNTKANMDLKANKNMSLNTEKNMSLDSGSNMDLACKSNMSAEAKANMDLKSNVNMSLQSNVNMALKSNVSLTAEGKATAELKSPASTKIQGAITQIGAIVKLG